MSKRLLTSLSIALAVAGGALVSCSHNDGAEGTIVTRNDFENVQGWGGSNDASITTEQAHSGKYSLKVGPQNEYGYTYVQTLGQMSTARVKKLTVSGWAWLPDKGATAQIVVSIAHSADKGSPVFYGSFTLPDEVKKYKSWQQISHTFTLPDSVQATNQLKCYLWRTSTNVTAYVDDFTLSVSN
ncbi:carbohydrate binding domain-containing protein [Hymenobacter sp. M29]|uniref:Carbohydrate binding domain-containing protein n=1 Tax=Hymenobacter mellowenesis TaxID=3063995 RepID=A0ABT9ADP0_9BACT|nr:carbohydrate binding domain-containing protein [Hymenobacter sp. M29]MDO7847951.1 carbohydrate binding domain-containing protein [Hymenobacter sp. M29]